MEGYRDVIQQRPEFDEKAWIAKRTSEEYKIMIASCTILNKNFPIWLPSLGVVK